MLTVVLRRNLATESTLQRHTVYFVSIHTTTTHRKYQAYTTHIHTLTWRNEEQYRHRFWKTSRGRADLAGRILALIPKSIAQFIQPFQRNLPEIRQSSKISSDISWSQCLNATKISQIPHITTDINISRTPCSTLPNSWYNPFSNFVKIYSQLL